MTAFSVANREVWASEPEITAACRFALREHGLREEEIIATLLFGSRVKGFANLKSDVDVIFIVSSNGRRRDFQYSRLYFAEKKLDCNVLVPAVLNKLCRNDADWAYRLQHARPIPELTRASRAATDEWLKRLDGLIESPEACRFRLIRHMRDCRFLLKAIQGKRTCSAGYLMIEVLFLVPLIYINAQARVPYESGAPWDEALTLMQNDSEGHHYDTLTKAIRGSEYFHVLSKDARFADELKRLRDKLRHLVEDFHGNIFGHSYGASLWSILRVDSELDQTLSRALPEGIHGEQELAIVIGAWLSNLQLKTRGRGRHGVVHRRRWGRQDGLADEPRLHEYDSELQRLKVIIPTGGCRVPTCTFCMLPQLARLKAEALNISWLRTYQHEPVRQLAVYTDGSFFDDRELIDEERLAVAEWARELKAEELLVETLPRFLTTERLDRVIEVLQPDCRLRIGVGIQSTDSRVRSYVTSTPVSQRELTGLLEYRRTGLFSLRVFLMINKPLMSGTEDSLDVYQSLKRLQPYLTKEDVVTINPLLPTRGTHLESLWKSGYWRPLRVDEAATIQEGICTGNWGFQVEFGPVKLSSCTDVCVPQELHAAPLEIDSSSHPTREMDIRCFPWSLLGGLRHRRSFSDRLATRDQAGTRV